MRRPWALAAFAVFAGCSEIQQPSPVELHNLIVYEGPNQFGTPSVWTINLDGSSREQMVIVGASGIVGGPEVSPDGRQIVLEFADNLYIANVDGSGWHALVMDSPPDRDPAWSPDGSRIAFISQRDGNPELYVVDSSGANAVRLTNSPDLVETHPSWSPDGQWIVVSAGPELPPTEPAVRHLWKVSSGGLAAPVQLTEGDYNDFHPDWSPVDDRIVFSSSRRVPAGLYHTNQAGAEPEQVNIGLSEPLTYPEWSPDGDEFIFNCFAQICRSSVDGANATSLTDDSFNAFSPQWVP